MKPGWRGRLYDLSQPGLPWSVPGTIVETSLRAKSSTTRMYVWMVVSAKLRNFTSPIDRSSSLVINDFLSVVNTCNRRMLRAGIRLPHSGFVLVALWPLIRQRSQLVRYQSGRRSSAGHVIACRLRCAGETGFPGVHRVFPAPATNGNT